MRAPYSRTLFDLVEEQADRYPQVLAAIDGDRSATYADLARRARAIAGALQRHGVVRRDRVGILINNRLEWLEACLAAGALGAVVAPFSTWSKRMELDFLLRDSQAKFILSLDRFGEQTFADDFAALVPEAAGAAPGAWRSARYPHLRGIVVLGPTESSGFLDYAGFGAGAPLAENPAPGDGASADDDAIILYTSGSSSVPKAVRMTHYGTIENGFNIGERQGLRPGDRVFCSVPLFWAYGGVNALPATLTHGATLVLQGRFEPGEALDLIERHGCTSIYTLPGMTSALIRHSAFAPERTKTLRTGLTIGSPQDVLNAATVLGAREICNVYGASETFGNCCVTWHHWPLEERSRCQGVPLPGVEMRIVDEETGEPVPPGKPGMVEVRGYLMRGYCGASAAQNEKAFTPDGFFRTGDMGAIGADGRFTFIGRKTEMIKKSGINVSPVEIEEVLLRHPQVAQAGVVGAEDAERGEIIVAFIVPVHDAAPTAEQLAAHCREMVSRYKVPDRFELCAALPLTTTGKLMRRELRDRAAAIVSAGAR